MQLNPKAIFLDMDGTILNHQNRVSILTKEIIDKLRAKGIYVFIATGRAHDEIEEIVPEGFKVDGVISSNGMAGYIDGEAVFEHSLSRELVDILIERARVNKVYYELFPYRAARISLIQDQQYMLDEIQDPKPDSVGINEWLSRKKAIKEEISWETEVSGDMFSKFYFFSRTKEHIHHWKEELEQLKREIDFTMSVSSEHNVEVMVANVNKATGIQQMIKSFNVKIEEVMAIGDSDNDIQMLQSVGYPVAMKNAPERIKKMVRDVTDFTCDEDGVYHYLCKCFT